jgi:heat shock protein HtpX
MKNAKVFVLMAGMTALLMAIGGQLGGAGGMMTMLLIAGAMNFFMYYTSSSMVLRMYKAHVVSEQDAPDLYRMVDRLRQRAGLPMPTVAIAAHDQPNAFATGRNAEHAVVCVTQGILRTLPPDELEGVLAHELGHIKNHDMLLSTITATMAAAISNLAFMGMFFGGRSDDDRGGGLGGLFALILAPIAASLIQLAISRQREFKADAFGASITGRPLNLASALEKLDAMAHKIPMQISPAVAPLAQVNPLAAHGGGISKLFSTHPPTAERVAALRKLAAA